MVNMKIANHLSPQIYLLLLLLISNTASAIESHDVGHDGKSGMSDGLSMTEVRSAIRHALVGHENLRLPSPRNILSINASGTTLANPIMDFTETFDVGTSCHDILTKQGASQSGLYLIHPPNIVQGPWKVYCDQESEGGGWTVFQVRDDVEPHENFMRNWEDYKVGFGDFDREFWLGNVLLWALTNSIDQKKYELAIDLEDWSGNKRFARYKNFRVGPETDLYRLYFKSMYLGNAGDSLASHNGLPFSTFDVDNDSRDGKDFAERSCSRLYKGGWWYGNCHDSNLNGWYLGGPHRSFADGINWYSWTGYNYSLRRTLMRFRPQKDTYDAYPYSATVSDSYSPVKQGSNQPSSTVSDSYLPVKQSGYPPFKGYRSSDEPHSEAEPDSNSKA